MEDRIKALENKIRNYDKYIFAAAVVAVIFGITGTFGLRMINNAQEKIDAVNKGLNRAGDELVAFKATFEEFPSQFDTMVSNAEIELTNKSNELHETIAKEILIALKKEVIIAGDKLSNFQILTGLVSARTSDFLEFPGGPCVSGPTGHRGIKNSWVGFSEEFESPPQVMISLNALDVYNDKDIRILVRLEEVTEQGFYFSLTTYCDTHISGAGAMWVAIGQ